MGRPKVEESELKSAQIQIRVSQPFKEWASELARERGESVSKLVLKLLVKEGVKRKFRPPP